MRTCARYGLRASRVGEASHPGPPLTRFASNGKTFESRRSLFRVGVPGAGTRNHIVSPPWVDMRRGDEGEVSLRRRIMADSETVPAEVSGSQGDGQACRGDMRWIRRHLHRTWSLLWNLTCVTMWVRGQHPGPATRRLVLVPVSRDVPRPMNEQDTPVRDFHCPIHSGSSGDPSDIG